MNRRHIIIVSSVLGVMAIGVLTVWRGCSESPNQIAPPKLLPESATGQMTPKSIKDPETKEEYDALVKEKSIAFSKSNNAPIAFYGRVIDQDGKPLEGVAVDFYVNAIPMIPVPWGPDERTKGSCATDKNGLFSVEGKRGISFGVSSLKKTGYRESGYYEQGHARYEPYGSGKRPPDREKPVDFMLIREDLPKAEKVFDKQLELNWNATIIIESFGPDVGKLEFTASRTGRDANNTTKQFEWEVKMRAEGFTMMKLPNENERMAPLVGYASNGRVGFFPNEKGWKSAPDESYAILTDSGNYGLVNLKIYAGRDDGRVSGRVTVFLNKSGARNIDHK